jgi:hypothetical protein
MVIQVSGHKALAPLETNLHGVILRSPYFVAGLASASTVVDICCHHEFFSLCDMSCWIFLSRQWYIKRCCQTNVIVSMFFIFKLLLVKKSMNVIANITLTDANRKCVC